MGRFGLIRPKSHATQLSQLKTWLKGDQVAPVFEF